MNHYYLVPSISSLKFHGFLQDSLDTLDPLILYIAFTTTTDITEIFLYFYPRISLIIVECACANRRQIVL